MSELPTRPRWSVPGAGVPGYGIVGYTAPITVPPTSTSGTIGSPSGPSASVLGASPSTTIVPASGALGSVAPLRAGGASVKQVGALGGTT